MIKSTFLTDTHCHIHMPPLCEEIADVVKRAEEAGVNRLLTVGIDANDSIRAAETADLFKNVYAACGIHPQDAESYDSESYESIKSLARKEKVIAIGEIGLDFYRNETDESTQTEVFAAMLGLSIELAMPVIIHNRNASEKLIDVLESEIGGGKSNGGIIHCFSGDERVLGWAIENNFYISYAGQLTYKSAQNLRDTLKSVPQDRLLFETDSPYLAPVPVRGKTNEPSYLPYTVGLAARELGLPEEELALMLEQNFTRLFGTL